MAESAEGLEALTKSELRDRVTELASHIHAATCRWLELVAELDRRKAWAGIGLRSCAHWLNWKCGIGLVAAREKGVWISY